MNFPPHFLFRHYKHCHIVAGLLNQVLWQYSVVDVALYGHYQPILVLPLHVHPNRMSQRSQGLFVVVARLIVCSRNELGQMVVECSRMLLPNVFGEEVC
jgi:hypothetical protein